jgi:hypothetical protein
MKRTKCLLAASVLLAASSGSVFAGLTNFLFDIDPLTDPALSIGQPGGAIVIGTHNYNNGVGNQIWSSGAGFAVDGNPASGGYLSISDGTNGNNNLVFVFPDIDNGLPLTGFQIDLDLRVGNSDNVNGRPADGFSISFARAGDIALVNATNSVVGGFAGGDGSVAAAASSSGSTDVENGTKTGVAVVFDAWQGNYLPDTTPYAGTTGIGSSAATDREGIAVRLDDHTLAQIDLILNRNEKDCVPTTQTTLANNGTGLSMQTGTNAPVLSGSAGACNRTYGSYDFTSIDTVHAGGGGSYTNLVWQHLLVRLTNNPPATPCTPPTFNLLVTWKGVTVINTNLASFAPYNGRLILAGRTGGNEQNCHVDNIRLFTRPLSTVFLAGIQGLLNGFTFQLNDNVNPPANAVFAGLVQVLLDTNNNVTAQTVVNHSGGVTTGTFQQAARFAPGSTHQAQICWYDSTGATNSTALSFTVPQWFQFPTNLAIAASALDTTKIGLRARAFQTYQNNNNNAWWTDELIEGRRGPNLAGTSSLATESDGVDSFLVWDGPMDLVNIGGANPQNGFFTDPAEQTDFQAFGLGNASAYPQNAQHDIYDNSALEFNGYIYFPTSGVYNMVIGSDDGFQLSTSQNPKDRMGTVLYVLNGNRTPTAASPPAFNDVRPCVVDQAGVYPIRLSWDNGGGQANLEWYTTPPLATPAIVGPGGGNSWLVNDTNNPSGGGGVATVFTYRALLPGNDVGPYVQDASPTRGKNDTVFYNPVRVVIADGTGSKTINDGTVSLSVDTVALPSTKVRSGNKITITQTSVPNWSAGLHTNVLSFADNLGTNYTYTWTWTVMGGVNGVAVADTTNSPVLIPASYGVALSAVDSSQPGFRIKPYQSYEESPNHLAWTEEQFQGLHGANLANLSGSVNGYFPWNALIDFRQSFAGSGALGGGAAGEFGYDGSSQALLGYSLATFGLGQIGDAYYFGRPNGQNHLTESSGLDIGAWLYFPTAGNYVMFLNSDDGVKLISCAGSPFSKLSAATLAEANVGRGMAGSAGGVQTGGTYAKFNIPAPGAYPFRIVYCNGGTDGGLEWSMYNVLSDGTVGKVAINDTNIPTSIRAYQTLLAGDNNAPFISYANPAYNAQDICYWQPVVLEINDGPGSKTVNTASIQLKTDGVVQSLTVTTPSAGVTRVLAGPYLGHWTIGGHTNILTFNDNASNTYSNWWPFNVMSLNFGAAIPIPITNRVDTSQVDHSRPGWRVKSYQTTAGNPNTIPWTEEQFEGLHGPNIADQSGTNGPGFFVWNDAVDFADNIGGPNGISGSGQYRWNFGLTNFGIVQNGAATESNNCSLMFAGWMEFTQAGTYAMTVNSDDGFKITSPNCRNPFNQSGIVLGFASTGRGNSGAAANPANQGSATAALFTIPSPGAYPIRMVYENGGGGENVEWTIFHYMPKGDVGRWIITDTNDPAPVKVYQTLSVDEPYILGVFPTPALPGGGGNNIGNGFPGPDLTLTPGIGETNINGGINQLTIQLQDGFTRTVNTNSISLTFGGVSQPLVIRTNGAGVTTIVRNAMDPPFWPSGTYGPLTLTFQDNTGTLISETWNLFTSFWGTLSNSLSLTQINTNSPGFALEVFQVDGFAKVTSGNPNMPTRIHVAEQVLAGLWGPNVARQTNLNDGLYWDLVGTGKSNGVLNLNIPGNGQAGDFQSGGGFIESLFPGIPGTIQFPAINANSNNSFVGEFLSYVEFPTNGTYTLGVSSDDGFRLTRGFNRPATIGAVVVNSPANVAGPKATVQDTFLTSYSLTSPVTANLSLSTGISFSQGATTNGEGCIITDPPGTHAGKILLMYRSAFCSYVQQVQNAAAAGAVGVILIQNRTNSGAGAESVFPQEPTVAPPIQSIPAVEIEQSAGEALAAIVRASGTVNVTLTPMENMINPPQGPAGPLGEADQGKGASDVLFPVVVQQAGVYPLRLVYFQGGGGGNCEFFSVTGTNRVLINDRTSTNGPGPGGSGLRAWYPRLSLIVTIGPGAGQLTITFDGILQSAPAVTGPYTDVPGSPSSPYTFTPSASQQFFRSRFP